MSTKGIRDFRPQLHFTPESGWINDPNGLVYREGMYHLFAQYYPEPHWGPMHWYHAVSTDLIHWQHLPIALAPDELGYIFSGSAVYDQENSSGFGKDGQAPVVAMYTSHKMRGSDDEHDQEQQSIAYSLDGVSFTKFEGNPVIPNHTLPDFRDPKIFHNPVRDCWGMVLAAGNHVEFYASRDLKSWEKTGEFGPEGNYSEGVWECPDLFPLTVNGKELWVLLVSMGPNEPNHGARTQYFTGSFDGDRFCCDVRFHQPEFVDAGFDNYAGVTYSGTPERLFVGWALNNVYASDTPTGKYCCQMTLPRTVTLRDTPKGGPRLAWAPRDEAAFGTASPCEGTLPGEVFKLTVTGSGAGTVTLSNSMGQAFRFGVDQENRAFIDRREGGVKDFSPSFARDWYGVIGAPRFYEGDWELQFIFDRSISELYIDGGTRVFTAAVYPDEPYRQITATGNVQIFLHEMH